MNYGVEQLSLVADVLYTLLTKGLGNRVDLIQPIIEDDFSWPIKKTLDKARAGYVLFVYLTILPIL